MIALPQIRDSIDRAKREGRNVVVTPAWLEQVFAELSAKRGATA